MNCTGYARIPLGKDVYIRFAVMMCPWSNVGHSFKAGFFKVVVSGEVWRLATYCLIFTVNVAGLKPQTRK